MIQAVRGTRDLLGADKQRARFIEEKGREICQRFSCQEIETPILESIDVFVRSLGESTDIVGKQMYAFTDRGGDQLVLRPEGTAGVARAFVSEGLAQHLPLKLFYNGPMFRYERPQKGRYRQFQQFGVELLGFNQAKADAECIAIGHLFLNALGLRDRTHLLINTVGDFESRQNYKKALTDYLRTRISELSVDSKERLEKNPLRILDSKDAADKAVVADGPLFSNYLNSASQDYFLQTLQALESLGIEFQKDPYLVRGLDYYCHNVFEFVTNDLGAQNAVLSGGRYDGLIEALGGSPTAGVGWAAGVDRLALMLPEKVLERTAVAVIPSSETLEDAAFLLSYELRRDGVRVEQSFTGNMAKKMKRADKVGAKAVIILGDEEWKRGHVKIKDLMSGEQKESPISGIKQELIAMGIPVDGGK